MKKVYLLSLLIMCCFTSRNYAQDVLGPYDIYVSKQNPPAEPVNKGSYEASADEGRVIKGKVFNIFGPIKVDPQEFNLDGPPCPTYENGKRNPKDPLPPNKKTLEGQVSMDNDNIPEPGTKVEAGFEAKDFGWWTKCAKGEKVPYDFNKKVKYNIFSIKIAFAAADQNISLCMDEVYNLKIDQLFPGAAKGKVTWASANGKVAIAGGDNTGCKLTAVKGGNDEVTATYTVDKAVFTATVKVKVCFVEFAKKENIIYWYAGGKANGKDFLSDKSSRDDLKWQLTMANGAQGAARIDANTGDITYPAAPGGTYNLTASINNAKNCKNNTATTKVIFLGYRIVLDITRNPCDGEEAGLHLECIPNTVPRAQLAGFMPIKLAGDPKQNFVGNEANKNALEFAALDVNYKSKVLNSYWYSTGPACNTWSQWEITAKGTVNGNATDATNKPLLTVSIAYPQCIEGSAGPVQTFTGAPVTWTQWVPARRRFESAVIGVGTLQRNVRGAVTAFKCPPNSQFFQFVLREENYHVGQIEGRNGNLCNDMWRVENVMALLAGRVWWGVNAQIASALSAQACLAAINIENMRSLSLTVYPRPRRCAIEAEAKQFTGIQFGFHMKCAYPACR